MLLNSKGQQVRARDRYKSEKARERFLFPLREVLEPAQRFLFPLFRISERAHQPVKRLLKA